MQLKLDYESTGLFSFPLPEYSVVKRETAQGEPNTMGLQVR
jgi:hypothetical protein